MGPVYPIVRISATNGLSHQRWLDLVDGQVAREGHGRTRATPVAPGARCPERSRWRCGAPAAHGQASPPSDRCRLALFVARAGPLLSGWPSATLDGRPGGAMVAARRE